MNRRSRRAQARAERRGAGEGATSLANRLMPQIDVAYKRAGLDMDKPEHQAVAVSTTMMASAIAAVKAGMPMADFVAFAQHQYGVLMETIAPSDEDVPP